VGDMLWPRSYDLPVFTVIRSATAMISASGAVYLPDPGSVSGFSGRPGTRIPPLLKHSTILCSQLQPTRVQFRWGVCPLRSHARSYKKSIQGDVKRVV
jgi:hypothetical protein